MCLPSPTDGFCFLFPSFSNRFPIIINSPFHHILFVSLFSVFSYLVTSFLRLSAKKQIVLWNVILSCFAVLDKVDNRVTNIWYVDAIDFNFFPFLSLYGFLPGELAFPSLVSLISHFATSRSHYSFWLCLIIILFLFTLHHVLPLLIIDLGFCSCKSPQSLDYFCVQILSAVHLFHHLLFISVSILPGFSLSRIIFGVWLFNMRR